MAKRIKTYDSTIKKMIIEDIAKIYCHYDKEHELRLIIRTVTYNSRTESGFESMIKMAKKIASKTSNLGVIKLYKDIEFLMGFYKRG